MVAEDLALQRMLQWLRQVVVFDEYEASYKIGANAGAL